jgi:hypothetical protein
MKPHKLLLLLLFSLLLCAQTTPNPQNSPPYNRANGNTSAAENRSLIDSFLSGTSAIPALKVAGPTNISVSGSGCAKTFSLTNTDSSPLNPNKYFRVNPHSGALEIMNSACAGIPILSIGEKGGISVTAVNKKVYADQSCSTPGTNDGSCLTNAVATVVAAGGGIVDATALTTMTSTTQIAVGNHGTQARVTLLLPPVGTWYFDITDGVSCGLEIFNLSRVMGTGTGVGSGFSLQPYSNKTNMDSLVCTDTAPIGGGNYVEIGGFGINDTKPAATFMNGLLHISKLYDDSEIYDMVVQGGSTGNYGVLVNGMCCGSTFTNFTVNGNSATGVTPFAVIDDGFGSAAVSCLNCSIDHPGARKPNVLINGTSGGIWNFYNLYMESNQGKPTSDTTTPLFQVARGNVGIYGGQSFHLVPRTTAYTFQISNAAGTSVSVRGFQARSVDGTNLNAINDLFAKEAIKADSSGNVPDFVGQPSYNTALNQVGASQYAGTSACSGSTKAIALPVAYNSQPAIFVFDETTKGGVSLRAKSTSSFTVSCAGASDTFDWMVVGNPN